MLSYAKEFDRIDPTNITQTLLCLQFKEYFEDKNQNAHSKDILEIFRITPEDPILFIAQHFHQLYDNEDIINWFTNTKFSGILEKILCHKELQVLSEDKLLLFLMKLAKKNLEYTSFFKYVYLEYCSAEIVNQFSDFYRQCQSSPGFNKYNDVIIHTLFRLNIKRQESPLQFQHRHFIIEYEYDESKLMKDGKLNGIFYNENRIGNLSLIPSSTNKPDQPDYNNPFNLLTLDKDKQFLTGQDDFPSITASLKNKDTFTIQKYMIKTNSDPNPGYKPWVLEGLVYDEKTRKSGTEWVVLHEQPLRTDWKPQECYTFDIPKEKWLRLTEVRIKLMEKDHLYLISFEMYGVVHRTNANTQVLHPELTTNGILDIPPPASE